jgi:hypothetical protein
MAAERVTQKRGPADLVRQISASVRRVVLTNVFRTRCAVGVINSQHVLASGGVHASVRKAASGRSDQ